MFDRLILKLANKILAKNGNQFIDGVYLARMSKEFTKWVYTSGYQIYSTREFKGDI